MDKDFIIKKMKEWKDSPQYQEYIDSVQHKESIDLKYIDKFHSFSPQKRLDIIKRIITKYESDDYYWREIKKGYEPRTPFYFLLYQYGIRYGKILMEDLNEYFHEQKVLIDDHIEVSLLFGQGTVANVKIL